MTAINRGSCFWCGEKVDDGDYDDVGRNRLWVCNKPECVKELRQAHREAYDDARQEFERDWKERW